MKLLTTILLTFIVSVSMAQTHRSIGSIATYNPYDASWHSNVIVPNFNHNIFIDTAMVLSTKLNHNVSFTSKEMTSFKMVGFVFGDVPKAMFSLYPYIREGHNVDSIKLMVHKQQIKWINDSTAIVTPLKQ